MMFFIVVTMSSTTLYCQEAPALPLSPPVITQTKMDSVHGPWKHTMIISASITQVSFTDWAQGGENSLAYALFVEGKSVYSDTTLLWENNYKFGYGQAKLGTQGIRKTDDKIDLSSVLTYKMGVLINPYASATMKTQFTEGETFDANNVGTPVSNFFDPAYLTQSAGVGYRPIQQVKTRLGIGLREIFTNHYNAYAGGRMTDIDGGLESVTDVGWTVMENVVLNATWELFSPLKKMAQITVRSDNTLSMKVNKFLSMNINVQLINDPTVQPRTQIKETLALGISYTIL